MRKRVLITGKDSYIGDMFAQYIKESCDVDILDVRTDEWKNADFSIYDAVVHVAAIVHKHKKPYSDEFCYKVNTELAYDVAHKAKCEGVSQIVFLSTMSVYGVVTGHINKNTPLRPFNIYGKTKLEAERKIKSLCDDSFVVAVLRPPIVYGKGCKGNYNELSCFAKKMPFFPNYKSQRSMIYIDDLCEIMKECVDKKLCGEFCPQDKCYVNTSNMVKLIANANGKKIRLTKIFNPFITLALKMKITVIQKVFGTLTYDMDLCVPFEKTDFETAINKTEQ